MLEFMLNFVYWVMASFFIAAPIGVGAYALFFSRRFSLDIYRYRKRVWKIGFTERDLRMSQVFLMIVGAGMLVGGTIVAAQRLF